jgi:hypothetical protein
MYVRKKGTGRNRYFHTRIVARGDIVEVWRGLSALGEDGVIITILNEKLSGSIAWPLDPVTHDVQITRREFDLIALSFGIDTSKEGTK